MRRTTRIVLTRGRDEGGVLELEEMAAFQACRWLTRAAQLLGRAGTNIPADIAENGITAFLALGMGAIIKGLAEAPTDDVDRLMDQLMSCCKAYTAPGASVALTDWRVIVTQIEEPATFLRIQEEALTLMVGFSIADALSKYLSRVAATIVSAVGRLQETLPPNSDTSSSAETPA